uniref:Acyl-CoA binding domain containing 4 n=1 Tax=Naja naja TaxID=35670 RepID=A0A8C6XCE4_NAJNA
VPMGLKTEEANCQTQFEAAVQVIQGLPRNGFYRPSYEEMLRFYGYYKQATMGQCQIPRPGFWDPIGRYKWDAWKSLGKMTKEEAMAAYIMEMKKAAQKVINTVPTDEASEDMFVYFEPLYEVIHDMPRPPESFFKKKSGMLVGSKSRLRGRHLGYFHQHFNQMFFFSCGLPSPYLRYFDLSPKLFI